MNGPIFFLDVNVPMYAAGADHPCKPACVWVLEEAAFGRLRVAIDTEVLQEILHRFGALRQPERGVRMATRLLDLVPTVYAVGVADMRAAIELFGRLALSGVKARDALHAAVMQNNGLTCIFSADEHFDRIEGITRIDVRALEKTRSDVERLRQSV